jgi:hypothetical protein
MSAGEKKVSLMDHITSAPDSAKMYIVLADGSYGYITKAEFLSGISGGSSGLSFHANSVAFPATGDIAKLYIDKSNEQIYRWNGTGYVAQDWQDQKQVLTKGNRPIKLVNLDLGDYTFVSGDEVKLIFFYGTANSSIIKFPNQIDGTNPFKEGDELICVNSNDPTEGTTQVFDISNIGASGDQNNFKYFSVAHIRLFIADGYGWYFSYENSKATTATMLDALKRDGSNANANVDLGSYNLIANEVQAVNSGFIGSNFQLVKVSDKVFNLIDNYGRMVAGYDGTTDYIYKYGNEALQYNETTDSFTWNGHMIATVDAIPDISHLATQTYADTVSGTAESNAKAYADGLVAGLLDLRGNYNASGNTYPSSGGSGTAGAILKGDFWYISVAGTLGGVAVNVGDSIYALTDSPGTTSTNWAVLDANLTYVAENSGNKTDTMAGNTASSTKYLSAKGVYDYLTGMAWLTDSIFGTWLSGNTAKTTPVDADVILIGDSADSNKSKKLSFTNLKVFLLAYFQGLFALKSDYMALTNAYGLANSTSLQKMFNVGSGSAGAFNTTANKSYKFRIEFDMTGLSSSAGTISFGFLGTAVITSINYKAETSKQALATAASPFIVSIQVATISAITSSTTATTFKGVITGIVRCTTAGTLIPAVATSVGIGTAQVEVNSYAEFTEIGSNTITATSNIS